MACLSCFCFVLCYSMCSNHCGVLEVAPLSFVMCVQDKSPNDGKHSLILFCCSPDPWPSYYTPLTLRHFSDWLAWKFWRYAQKNTQFTPTKLSIFRLSLLRRLPRHILPVNHFMSLSVTFQVTGDVRTCDGPGSGLTISPDYKYFESLFD